MPEPSIHPQSRDGHPPQQVGKYRLIRKLATGGMAQIHLALIEGAEGFVKPVVVKTMLPEFEQVVEFSDMFVREAKTMALFDHPNIVQVLDFGKFGDRLFLAMEWVDGVTLEQLMRRAASFKLRLGYRATVTIGLALGEALAYVQSLVATDGVPLNIVHRDLSPGNTLVSKTGLVKLTDFGVAKNAAFPGASQSGEVRGKFEYMSPEQLRNEPLDGRSDVYSMGIVLYEMATGRRLFKRPTLAETMRAVVDNEVPWPSTLCPDFPPELERIVLKALAPDRSARYAGAREMLADLAAFQDATHCVASAQELASIVASLFSGSASASGPGSAAWSPCAMPRLTLPAPAASVPLAACAPGASAAPARRRRSVGLAEIGLVAAAALFAFLVSWLYVAT